MYTLSSGTFTYTPYKEVPHGGGTGGLERTIEITVTSWLLLIQHDWPLLCCSNGAGSGTEMSPRLIPSSRSNFEFLGRSTESMERNQYFFVPHFRRVPVSCELRLISKTARNNTFIFLTSYQLKLQSQIKR